MSCPVCDNPSFDLILNQPTTTLWTNAPDGVFESPGTHPCVLRQCQACRHVYQPLSPPLKTLLQNIYESKFSVGSTPKGVGNYGEYMASHCLKNMGILSPKKPQSVLEIGCSDGYFLDVFKKLGFSRVVGIDPCIAKDHEKDGVFLVRGYVTDRTELNESFDLIFSTDVLEHVEDVNAMLGFCQKHLTPAGRLSISVPNFERLLESGDPAAFMHQHLHCFTPASLEFLFQNHGLYIDKFKATALDYYVNASLTKGLGREIKAPTTRFHQFDDLVSKNLQILKATMNTSGKTYLHGVNSTLNNVLHWMESNLDFALIDNDETKHGELFLGKRVGNPAEINFSSSDSVIIITSTFQEEIQNQYRYDLGFTGKIHPLIRTTT
jgi:SAM-dependent methyltransferase